VHHKSQCFKHFGVLMANKTLFWSFYVSFCAFCASLWLTRTVFSRLMKKAVSMALWTKASLCVKSSLSEQNLPRTPSRPKNPCNPCNPWLINDLRACKALYICRDTFTDVMDSLQIRPFMQNKAKVKIGKMNISIATIKDYGKNNKQSTTNVIQNEAKRSQTKPKLKWVR